MLAQLDTLHPFIGHFPVALLTVAPGFLIAGLIVRRQRMVLFTVGWAVTVVGTVGAFVAVASGEAAFDAVTIVPQGDNVDHLLAEHEERGELTRLLFSILAVVWGGLLLAPSVLKRKPSQRGVCVVAAVFLLAYVGCVGVLLSAAHLGGRVVHEHHVTAGI